MEENDFMNFSSTMSSDLSSSTFDYSSTLDPLRTTTEKPFNETLNEALDKVLKTKDMVSDAQFTYDCRV